MQVRPLLLSALFALPTFATAAAKPVAAPDYSEVCHPGESKGVVLCETAESYQYCKTLEGKGRMQVEGDATGKPTAVVQCQQSG